MIDAEIELPDDRLIAASSAIEMVDLTPWLGFGRNTGSILTLAIDDGTVDLFSSFDTRSTDPKWHAGANLFYAGQFKAQYLCVETFEGDWLDPVFDAKINAGQCWDRESESWKTVCD